MLRLDLNLVWTIVNVLIIYFLIKRFLFKPIHNIIDKRQWEINEQYEAARLAEEKAGELKTQYDTALTGAEVEKTAILEAARAKAAGEYDKLLEAARQDAGRVLADAKLAADKEQQKRIKEAQTQITDLVFAATAKIVAAKTSEESDRELYNQFIVKAGEQVE